MCVHWGLPTTISMLTIVFLAMTNVSLAQPIVGRWEKVDLSAPGTEIVIRLKSGERIDCAFKNSTPQDLTIAGPDGSERRVPKSAVDSITSRREYRDPAGDGALKGLLAGLAAGVAFGAITSSKVDSSERPFLWGVGLFLGGGIGAGAGYVGDKLHKGHEVLYRAR